MIFKTAVYLRSHENNFKLTTSCIVTLLPVDSYWDGNMTVLLFCRNTKSFMTITLCPFLNEKMFAQNTPLSKVSDKMSKAK